MTVRPRLASSLKRLSTRQLLVGIKMVRGLIEQKDLRVLGEQGRHGTTALLPAGEGLETAVRKSRQTHFAQGRQRQTPILGSLPRQQ